MKQRGQPIKKVLLILMILQTCICNAQDSTSHQSFGLTIFTVCEDINSSFGVHILPGIQYKYEFPLFDLRSSLDYTFDKGDDPDQFELLQSVTLNAGIEKVYCKGWFHLTQGVDLLVRTNRLEVEHENHNGTTTEYYTVGGPALTGGFICSINRSLSIEAELDVEFLFYSNGFEILATPVRLVSLDYHF